MVDAVRRFAGGDKAIGLTEPHIPVAELHSFEGIVSKSTNWRTLGVSERELAMVPNEDIGAERAMATAK